MKVNGKNIRALRTAQGMTVSELAKRCGTTQPHISNIEIEGGRNCSARMLVLIANALAVDVCLLERNRDFPDSELHLYLASLKADERSAEGVA